MYVLPLPTTHFITETSSVNVFLGFFVCRFFLLLFNYSCPHFPPITLPLPYLPPPPTFHPFPRLSLSIGPLCRFLDDPPLSPETFDKCSLSISHAIDNGVCIARLVIKEVPVLGQRGCCLVRERDHG